MKIILVTGCCGFIGTHLVEALARRYDNVHIIGIDNFISGQKYNLEYLNSNSAVKNKFTFKLHDIIHPLHIYCHEIYNLACPASPVHYRNNAIHTIKTNTIGMINMLELAKENKAKILQASTSEVYGDPKIHPQTEKYYGNVSTTGPRACYDEGKRVAETLCYDYQRTYNVDVRVARIFNTYGPFMAINDGRVISNFIVQCLNNKDITVYGKGLQTRSFCYVSDLIEGLIKLMESDYSSPVNLGNPDEYKIIDIANVIKDMIGSTKSEIKYKKLPKDDPKKRKPDISVAKSILNWKPKVSLYDGLKSTIDYFADLKNKGLF